MKSRDVRQTQSDVRIQAMLFMLSLAVFPFVVSAQELPPSPSPTPSASPNVTKSFSLGVTGSNVFLDQSTNGPGITPPEAGSFAAGLPLAPMSPYDWFTGAPVTPGVAGQFQYLFTGTERMRTLTIDATMGLTALAGDVNNLEYWGEPLFAQLDPHQGRSPLNSNIVFPTHAGQNDAYAGEVVLPYHASLRSNDDAWRLSGGYFDLAQSDRFVFAPAPITSVVPSVGAQTAETLGPGMPSVVEGDPPKTSLPLLGADFVAKRGNGTLELTDALLPQLPGTMARLTMGSFVLDRGDVGRFSAQVMNVRTTGDPISSTTFFGTQPTLYSTPQGILYTSTLADQHQTIAGVRAFWHPWHGDDALVELGRAWYNAGLVSFPGTSKPGNYEHFAFARHFDSQTAAGVDYYRFEPRYATVILPYGIPENIWSVAWSWPGQWLKSNYQSIDNSQIGINREGFRLHADRTQGRFEFHADYEGYRQIEPMTVGNASQTGWVDGFFLPQCNVCATVGWQRQVGLYSALHLDRDDIAVDAMWDRSYRPITLDARDFVSVNYPQLVISEQHHFSKKSLAVIGYGRYSANGTWATTPVLGIYGLGFAGAAWDLGRGQQLLIQLRRYALTGIPSMPGGPAPTMRGTALIVDHRISF